MYNFNMSIKTDYKITSEKQAVYLQLIITLLCRYGFYIEICTRYGLTRGTGVK